MPPARAWALFPLLATYDQSNELILLEGYVLKGKNNRTKMLSSDQRKIKRERKERRKTELLKEKEGNLSA